MFYGISFLEYLNAMKLYVYQPRNICLCMLMKYI